MTNPQGEVVLDEEGNPRPAGPPVAAASAPIAESSPPPDGLPRDAEVTFLWDVKANLGDRSATARMVITPIEDGREGAAEASVPFRAGNTPPTAEGGIEALIQRTPMLTGHHWLPSTMLSSMSGMLLLSSWTCGLVDLYEPCGKESFSARWAITWRSQIHQNPLPSQRRALE